MRELFSSEVNNSIGARNVYGAASGATTGQRAGATTPMASGPGARAASAAPSGAAPAAARGLFGQPFSWWVVLIGLLVGLMWTAQRFGGQADEFKTVRLSIYNIVVITLAAIIGLGFTKLIFARYRVPGLSDYIEAI